MKASLLLPALCSLALSAFGAERLTTDSRTVGRYRVTITAAPLDARRDALVITPIDRYPSHSSATLHGREFYGTDGSVPRTGSLVVRSVSLLIGTHRYDFAPELFRDLVNPCIGSSCDRAGFTVSENPRYITVNIFGGYAAGSYECRWRISKSRLDVRRSIHTHPLVITEFPPDGTPQKLIPNPQ